jgi:hypothetical protein
MERSGMLGVKDRLEDRLHALVVHRKLDLKTAQQEIATDWIAAYKKYVGPSQPAVVAYPTARKHQGNQDREVIRTT